MVSSSGQITPTRRRSRPPPPRPARASAARYPSSTPRPLPGLGQRSAAGDGARTSRTVEYDTPASCSSTSRVEDPPSRVPLLARRLQILPQHRVDPATYLVRAPASPAPASVAPAAPPTRSPAAPCADEPRTCPPAPGSRTRCAASRSGSPRTAPPSTPSPAPPHRRRTTSDTTNMRPKSIQTGHSHDGVSPRPTAGGAKSECYTRTAPGTRWGQIREGGFQRSSQHGDPDGWEW